MSTTDPCATLVKRAGASYFPSAVCDWIDACGACNGDNSTCIIGCDGIINSTASFDQCGVCNGDSSSCVCPTLHTLSILSLLAALFFLMFICYYAVRKFVLPRRYGHAPLLVALTTLCSWFMVSAALTIKFLSNWHLIQNCSWLMGWNVTLVPVLLCVLLILGCWSTVWPPDP